MYLAGPDVFLADSAEVGRRKQAICRAHGLVAHYPGEEGYTAHADDYATRITADVAATVISSSRPSGWPTT
ncbi:MAG TPA: nucleoside 2-deoxyribosyltransferase [Acidimicrobiia bacterium]|nr:nucleoside 2-deoxyribosyltransferase [Acidimicrobiia bacterium]